MEGLDYTYERRAVANFAAHNRVVVGGTVAQCGAVLEGEEGCEAGPDGEELHTEIAALF